MRAELEAAKVRDSGLGLTVRVKVMAMVRAELEAAKVRDSGLGLGQGLTVRVKVKVRVRVKVGSGLRLGLRLGLWLGRSLRKPRRASAPHTPMHVHPPTCACIQCTRAEGYASCVLLVVCGCWCRWPLRRWS